MYIYIGIYAYVNIYVYVCMYIYIYNCTSCIYVLHKSNIYLYVYTPMWRCIYMHEYMFTYIYTLMYVHIYIYIYIHSYVYKYIDMYIYIYIYMYIYIYIYTYICLVTWVTQVSHSCLSQCRSRDRDRIGYLIAESDSDLSDFFLSRLPTESRVGWVPSRVNIRARWTVRIRTVCIETPIRTNRRKTASFGPGGRRGAKFSSQELSFRQLLLVFRYHKQFRTLSSKL